MNHVIQDLTSEAILLFEKEDLPATALSDLLNPSHITTGRKKGGFGRTMIRPQG